jgi:hypothetical protein
LPELRRLAREGLSGTAMVLRMQAMQVSFLVATAARDTFDPSR